MYTELVSTFKYLEFSIFFVRNPSNLARGHCFKYYYLKKVLNWSFSNSSSKGATHFKHCPSFITQLAQFTVTTALTSVSLLRGTVRGCSSIFYAPPPWLCEGRSNSQWLASPPIKVLVNFTLEVFLSSLLWNPACCWNFTQFCGIKRPHPLLPAIHNLWSRRAKYSISINNGPTHSSGKPWFRSKSFSHYSQNHMGLKQTTQNKIIKGWM